MEASDCKRSKSRVESASRSPPLLLLTPIDCVALHHDGGLRDDGGRRTVARDGRVGAGQEPVVPVAGRQLQVVSLETAAQVAWLTLLQLPKPTQGLV